MTIERFIPAAGPIAVLGLMSMLTIACSGSEESEGNAVEPPQSAGNVSTARLEAEASLGDNWLVKGGSLTGDHYSPLDQIHAKNVAELGLAWATDIPSPIGLVAEPIVVDGVAYFSAPKSIVYAVDAATGERLWTFDPEVDVTVTGAASIASRFNRGVAVWEGAVIVGTGDCRLVAIDAAKGTKLWDTLGCDPMNGAHIGGGSGITGAPLVADDKVFIGYLGAEAGGRGSIAGFDAATGKELWRFWTVPGDPTGPVKGVETKELEMASKTWPKGWATYGGGGVWDGIHYDPVTGFVIFGTGSPMPHPINVRGEGDALFTNSVIAVDANTGEYKWHFQTVPEDAWDYDATMPKIVTDLTIAGNRRRVVLESGKSGFFYVLDAHTGELIAADAIAKVTWASRVDMETGRPVVVQAGRYWENEDPEPIAPAGFGARNWEPPAYSPDTGLVYMTVSDMSTPFTTGGYPNPDIDNIGLDHGESPPPDSGRLLAWDPVKRKKRWAFSHQVPYNGGVLATAGNLVFQGTGTGELMAYDAARGDLLWSIRTGSSIQAAPVTYRVGDDQYVLVTMGSGGGMRLIINRHATTPDARGPARVMAFKLGGAKEVPIDPPAEFPIPEPPVRTANAEKLKGAALAYTLFDCGTCHGAGANALAKTQRGGAIPDLRYSPFLHTGWDSVVLNGALADQGMPAFGARGMTPEQAEAARLYVVEQAWLEYEDQQRARAN